MLTEERKAILKEKYSKWYVVSKSQGMGLCEALEQADADGAYVYERLTHGVSVTIGHNERLLSALKRARRAMTNDRYLKPRIGMEAECAEADAIIAEVEAYNAAELEAIAKYDDPRIAAARRAGA